jgi:glutamate---cysteine ligase / carboxylate-amine ligase
MGVEEELLLVDDAGHPRGVASSVLSVAGETAEVDAEFLDEQIETGTEPCTGAEELAGELRRRRRAANDAAGTSGARVAALATSPVAVDAHLSPGDRYRRIVDQYGRLASEQLSSGCHVHVEVTDLEEGVGVLDRLGPWLPVLRAMTANSPYWHGEDTGYESYRSTVWNRWPSAGPTGPFGSLAGYDRAVTAMVDSGALLDEGMVYFDARLSRALSTVELRVADVCLEVDDAVLYALLARALVSTEARRWREDRPPSDVRAEVLALAHWRAARSGLTGDLVHPRTGLPAPAHAVLGALCEHVADALAEAGDSELVATGCARLRERGTGASTQRALAAQHGGDLAAVVRETAGLTVGDPARR